MWYSLRLEGHVLDQHRAQFLNLMAGNPSLEELLHRLSHRLAEAIDATAGTFPNGLKAAVIAQLALGQWENLAAFRHYEAELERPYPPMTIPVSPAPSSGSS